MLLENNTFNATGDTAMAIGVIGLNIQINNNNLTVNGTSISGSTVDYLGARTTGVYIGRGYNVTVTNNNINSTYTGIYTQEQNTLNVTTNNITTNYNYTILIDKTTQNTTVENNYLVTPGRLGDESVSDSGKNNTVQNNQPVPDKQYFLKVDTTEFTAGTTTTITASIYYGTENTQTVATNITKGKITFKVNGKTLKNTNGKVIYAKIVNGTATIEDFEVPESWAKEGTTIQAVYSGSSDLEKMTSEKTEITITTTEPTITTEDITTSAGETITLTATLTDGNNVINNGKVVFKINGKTVKDSNGKVIYAKVSNNQVNFTYTLPSDMKAKQYNLTATFISSDYDRLEDTKTLTVTA
nr:right-handed parallel beta-helix repeat-containing protein [Methanosphaera sp. BMS]